MSVFRVVIRSSTVWAEADRARVLRRASALEQPPSALTDRGLELSLEAETAEAAKQQVEAAVHGIHSHTGVYLAAELEPFTA